MTTTQHKPLTTAAPAGLTAAAVGSGGTFAAATYFWKITFMTSALGESPGSSEVTAAIVLNGSANLTWTAPPSGVTAVKVYRGTVTNTENVLVATLPNNSAAPVAAYTDTGSAGSAASPPATPAFAAVTLDAVGCTLAASTFLVGAQPGTLHNALRAFNQWHNCAGLGTAAQQAQSVAAACGLTLQDV